MKWLWVIVGVSLVMAGLCPQLHTRLRPAYPAVRRVKRHAWAIPMGRGVVFFGYARLA